MRSTVSTKIKNGILALIPFIAIFAIWNVAVHLHWLPSWFLPTPAGVAATFAKLAGDGTLLKIITESVINLVPPYILAVIIAITGGIVIGTSRTARKIFFPFIATLYPIPTLAWLPFVIILFGFTREAVWILLFSSTFLKMIYNMIGGVRNLNPIWILAARNLGLKKGQIIFKVIIPGALPNIITAMRLGFGAIWRSVIASEMLVGGAGGLGNFMINAQFAFDFDKIFVSIIVIACIGLLVETGVFKMIEQATIEKWGVLAEKTT